MPIAIGELKQCPRCNETKHVSEFCKRRDTKDGYNPYCKKCASEYKPKRSKKEFYALISDGYKECSRCDTIKQTSDFYKSYVNKSGLDSICKECRKEYEKSPSRRSTVKKYRKSTSQKQKEYSRKYNTSANGKERLERYKKTENYQEAKKKTRETQQYKARAKVNKSAETGKIPHISTRFCCVCGERAEQYHHHLGYAKEHWLDVIPVCIDCHWKLEKNEIEYQQSV